MSRRNPNLTGRPGHNRGRRFPVETLTEDEVAALMAAMNRGATGDRNRALVAVLYRAGLRLSEALALRATDINVAEGTIRVLYGKGAKARTVGVDDGGLLHITRWADRRERLGLSRRGPLFMTLDGSPWSPQSVRMALSYAQLEAAGATFDAIYADQAGEVVAGRVAGARRSPHETHDPAVLD